MKLSPAARSPLSRPGARRALARDVAKVADRLGVERFVEPFAGTGAVSLLLAQTGLVARATLADADEGIASFWAVALTDPVPLIDLVHRFFPTRERFLELRASSPETRLGRAFRTLALSRLSWSGIIGAGPASRMEQRWRPETLAERIGRIFELGASGILSAAPEAQGWQASLAHHKDALAFIDPPYPEEGPRLYAHSMDEPAHDELARLLLARPGPSVVVGPDTPDQRRRYAGAIELPTGDRPYSLMTRGSHARREVVFLIGA
nr:DNA adenine methylase [Pseudoclavibacter soli]